MKEKTLEKYKINTTDANVVVAHPFISTYPLPSGWGFTDGTTTLPIGWGFTDGEEVDIIIKCAEDKDEKTQKA